MQHRRRLAYGRRTKSGSIALEPHTHRQRENTLRRIRGYNVGGDYGWKRLLWLEWPAGTVAAHTFGQPED